MLPAAGRRVKLRIGPGARHDGWMNGPGADDADDEMRGGQRPRMSSHADLAYRALEEAIVTLQLLPGTMVTEARVIALAGLGRTPVREALLRLAGQGLLGILPRKGVLIAPIASTDLMNVLEAREALERTVIVAAAMRASADERRHIQALANEMREAAAANDAVRYMQRDKMLDEAIVRAAGNPYAGRALEPLQTLMRRAWFALERERDLNPAALHHMNIAQAVVAGDAGAAAMASDGLIGHMRAMLRSR
jgi:DNA-binding GntR family transcriptional regulator